MSKYILVDEYTHDEMKGKPKYFKQMTGIGPMATPDISEAELFESHEDAAVSPANRHWTSNWNIQELVTSITKSEQA